MNKNKQRLQQKRNRQRANNLCKLNKEQYCTVKYYNTTLTNKRPIHKGIRIPMEQWGPFSVLKGSSEEKIVRVPGEQFTGIFIEKIRIFAEYWRNYKTILNLLLTSKNFHRIITRTKFFIPRMYVVYFKNHFDNEEHRQERLNNIIFDIHGSMTSTPTDYRPFLTSCEKCAEECYIKYSVEKPIAERDYFLNSRYHRMDITPGIVSLIMKQGEISYVPEYINYEWSKNVSLANRQSSGFTFDKMTRNSIHTCEKSPQSHSLASHFNLYDVFMTNSRLYGYQYRMDNDELRSYYAIGLDYKKHVRFIHTSIMKNVTTTISCLNSSTITRADSKCRYNVEWWNNKTGFTSETFVYDYGDTSSGKFPCSCCGDRTGIFDEKY